jgi:hypothetical protein
MQKLLSMKSSIPTDPSEHGKASGMFWGEYPKPESFVFSLPRGSIFTLVPVNDIPATGSSTCGMSEYQRLEEVGVRTVDLAELSISSKQLIRILLLS